MLTIMGTVLNMLALPTMFFSGLVGVVMGVVFAVNEKWDMLFSYKYFLIWWCVFCCFGYRRTYARIRIFMDRVSNAIDRAIIEKCNGFFDRHFGLTYRSPSFFGAIDTWFFLAVAFASLLLGCFLVYLYFRVGSTWEQLVADRRFVVSTLIIYPALVVAPYVEKVFMIALYRIWAAFADRVFGPVKDYSEEVSD